MITKKSLREEYETETGKKHGNALFSTTDYACWLEKRIVKKCSITDVVERSEQLPCEHPQDKIWYNDKSNMQCNECGKEL